jgi:TM2 domain-containing membrane protein YozV
MSENIEFEKMKLEAQQIFPEKNLVVGYALLLFLWFLGAHRFYYGKNISAVIMLVLSLSIIGMFITSFWFFIDIYFVYKYNEEQNKVIKLHQIKYLEKMEHDQKKKH